MKKKYLFFFASVSLMVSCKKDDKPAPNQGSNALTTAISSQFAKMDSISSFNSYFKVASLSDAEVSGGVTVFALPNSAFGSQAGTPGEYLPDSSLVKDYIVKGVLRSSDFTNNKTLSTLSGKSLTVTLSGDTVKVNGVVVVVSAPFAAGTNYTSFLARQLWRVAAPVTITVWDATKWAENKPSGELAGQATVALYHSQEDYAGKKPAAYTATTDNTGKVTFSNLTSGTYYIVASKGGASSSLPIFADIYQGVYLGYAVDPLQLDGTGNYVHLDVNEDGKIDGNDITAQPAFSIDAAKGNPANTIVSIGSAFRKLGTGQEAQDKLDMVYYNLKGFYEPLLLADGAMSDDAGCESVTSWCPFNNFTFTASADAVDDIWSSAYGHNITTLNYILRDVPALDIAADQKSSLIAQARGLRGYIYLQLITYFGDVPINKDLDERLNPGITRKPAADVYDSVVADLTAAAQDLPATTSTKDVLTKNAALGLLAKAALYKKDYAKVLEYTSQIISSGSYSLTTANSWFNNQNTTETIWAPQFSVLGGTSSWYFTATFGGIEMVPVLRYGQVLLMNAEAKIMSGDLAGAQSALSPIRLRDELSTATISNASEGMNVLDETWKKDMLRQGDRFSNLVRWQTAPQVLGANGYSPGKSSLLPVPLEYLQLYPGLNQNPGY